MTASMKRRNEKRKRSMDSSLAYSPSKSDFDDDASANNNNNNHFRNTMNIGGSRNSMTPRRTSRSSSVLDSGNAQLNGGNALFNKTFTPKQFKTFKFSASLKNFIDE